MSISALPQRTADAIATRLVGLPPGAALAIAAYAAIGAGAIGGYFAEDASRGAIGYLVVSLLPVVALVLGPLYYRVPTIWPWLFLAGGQAAFFIGDLVWFSQVGPDAESYPTIADAAYVVAYPLLATGIALFISSRRPSRRLLPFIDAFAIGIAGALVLWLVHIETFVHDPSWDLLAKLTLLAYPVGDALLLGAAAYLLLAAPPQRGSAQRLVAGALALLLVADVLYSDMLVGSGYARSWVDGLWLLSYLFLGLAALVPSMRTMTEPTPAVESRTGQLLPLGVALASVPLFAAGQHLMYRHLDLDVLISTLVVIGALLLLRMHVLAVIAASEARRYAVLLEHATEAFTVLDPDGTVQIASPTSTAILGIPPSDVVGRNVLAFLEHVHPESRQAAQDAFAALVTPGAVVHQRIRLQTTDDAPRWLDVTASNRTRQPEVGGIVLNYHDVTESVIATERLRRSHDLVVAGEQVAGVASWEWDGTTGTPSWSEQMWHQLGLDPTTTVLDNSTLYRCVHPDDLARVQEATLRSFRDAEPLDLEFRIQRPDGAVRLIHATAKVFVDEAGRPIRTVGANLDVTESRRAQKRLQFQADILANVRESVIVTDLEGTVTHWSAGAERIFGFRADEMIGSSLAPIYRDPPETIASDLARILDGIDYHGEWLGRRKDGSSVWIQVHTTVMRDRAGRPVGFIGVGSDVTEDHARREQLARLEKAIDQSSESVVIANAAAEIEYVNPAFERVTGYSADEVIGRNPRILKSGSQPDSFYRAMWATLLDGRPWIADFTNRRKDGSLYEEEAVISPIRSESGTLSGYVAVKRDVTEERRLVARAERGARERALIAQTIRGINMRETPEETAQAVCQQVASLADIATAGLFIFELDARAAPYGFVVNDGPMPPLRRVPSRRSDYLRSQASRGPWIEGWEDRPWHPYNGVFVDLGVKAIAYAPLRDDGRVIGFLHISSAAPDAESQLADCMPALVEFADIASALLGAGIAARTELESVRIGIRRLIREQEFHPVFQPIVDISSDEVVGYEALTRFHDGRPPDVHYSEAHEVGLGGDLELATLRLSLRAAADLPRGKWLNLNASPHLILGSDDLLRLVLSTAKRDVVLEVTEHAAVTDYDAFRRAVEQLGPQIRLAVDDAGAGFASLRHIVEMRPAFVKLDRGLIAGISSDDARQALVAGMRHFTRTTGMWLIAEGVETPDELEALRSLDIRLAQGYLLGRPAAAPRGPSVGSLASRSGNADGRPVSRGRSRARPDDGDKVGALAQQRRGRRTRAGS